jgi:hypothetical protein
MKTSLDLPEPLLRDVQALAKKRGTTTKSLVEQALIRILAEAESTKPYELPDLSAPGGLTPEFANAPWERIRDEIYGTAETVAKLRGSDDRG